MKKTREKTKTEIKKEDVGILALAVGGVLYFGLPEGHFLSLIGGFVMFLGGICFLLGIGH
jgi:hypothetical protein